LKTAGPTRNPDASAREHTRRNNDARAVLRATVAKFASPRS
jgi:hypothetical protein